MPRFLKLLEIPYAWKVYIYHPGSSKQVQVNRRSRTDRWTAPVIVEEGQHASAQLWTLEEPSPDFIEIPKNETRMVHY